MSGTLYMIPCPIAEESMETIPTATMSELHKIDHFVVERLRTARRFLSAIGHPTAIDDMTFFEYDKHNPLEGLFGFLKKLGDGKNIAVLSEAGCPGIADPGRYAVQYAHREGYKVVPLVGPSSILLALMASGFSGQSFTFHGYLPAKKPALVKQLKQLYSQSAQTTQIFMEAPYRNKFLIASCVEALPPHTELCVACDLNAPDELILRQALSKWAKYDLERLHKRPAIFLLGEAGKRP